MAVLPRVFLLVAVAVLAACTSRFGGTPVAGTSLPSEPEELTAEAVFDDFTTVDPCSLTDLSVFESFGTATFGVPEWLDYCVVNVSVPGGGSATLNIGMLGELTTTPEVQGKRVKEVERGIWVGQYFDEPDYCAQLLVFPDGVTMEVHAYESAAEVDTCPMVEAGMDHVIDVVLDEGVAHRQPERNSLVLVDPCSLIDDAEVVAVPGLAGVRKPNDFPAKHRCYWRLDETLSLAITFGAGTKADHYSDTVAGRPSTVVPVDLEHRSYCSVDTPHIPFTEVEGVDDAVELASVFVHMPAGQQDAACAAARAVAEIAWPELPAA